MKEFARTGGAGEKALFSELCFCILTANYTSAGGMRIQKAIGGGFLSLPRPALAARLKSLGHRFPNARARYIAEARRHFGRLGTLLRSHPDPRGWLAENVLGLGYKEASHFLRNVGFDNYAILDFHILDLLAREGVIKRPKSLAPKRYLEIESALARMASAAGVSQGELDLYLWYLETGKILK